MRANSSVSDASVVCVRGVSRSNGSRARGYRFAIVSAGRNASIALPDPVVWASAELPSSVNIRMLWRPATWST